MGVGGDSPSDCVEEEADFLVTVPDILVTWDQCLKESNCVNETIERRW